ncbi:MAG TPA: hypothetical protein VKT17_09990, partial [Acidobacteriota bacterium]|nr:hypothetical protein [Acidobacteriota bacterium]
MPRLRPQETMVTARKNFRRMMRLIAGRDDIEITTYRELMDVYGNQKETMTREDLRGIAGKTLREKALAPTDDFSPAEIFAGLAGAISGFRKDGRLPASLTTVHPLGPMEMPSATGAPGRATLEEIFALAQAAKEHIGRTGALPSSLEIGGERIGTGSLFALFSAVFLDLDAGRTRAAYDVPAFEPYPRTNEQKIIAEIQGYKTWPVHKPDLDMSRIVEFTKLQLWTLKPARRQR